MQKREQILLLIVIIFIALLFILALTIFYPAGNGKSLGDNIFAEKDIDTIIEYIRPSESDSSTSSAHVLAAKEDPIVVIEEAIPSARSAPDALPGTLQAPFSPERASPIRPEITGIPKDAASSDNLEKRTGQTLGTLYGRNRIQTSPLPSVSSSTAGSDSRAKYRRTAGTVPQRSAYERQYWVQLLATPNYLSVKRIQDLLSKYGIGSIVIPYRVGSVLYMRVRVGPYYYQKEAEKFAAWFRSVRDLSESYVSRGN